MAKFRKETSGDDGWSREIMPIMTGYKLACCDCGLVHDTEFYVVYITKRLPGGDMEMKALHSSNYRVVFKVRRNARSTAALRREEKKRKAKEIACK